MVGICLKHVQLILFCFLYEIKQLINRLKLPMFMLIIGSSIDFYYFSVDNLDSV